MLAQNFKTAEALGIATREFEALQKALVLFETGKIIHQPEYDWDLERHLPEFSGHFNMTDWGSCAHCGTVACIGGTAELVGGLVHDELRIRSDKNSNLHDLFYPPTDEDKWYLITPAQAARALRSYLTTGDARWYLALSPQDTVFDAQKEG